MERQRVHESHLSTLPRQVDVVFLLRPLEPHAEAVLQKCRHEAQSSKVREIVLRVAEEAVGQIVRFGHQPFVRVATASRHSLLGSSFSLLFLMQFRFAHKRSFLRISMHNVRGSKCFYSVPSSSRSGRCQNGGAV